MEQEIIVGLDIGTTKVCAIVASVDEGNRFNVLGVGRSPSDGLTRGVVTNIDKTGPIDTKRGCRGGITFRDQDPIGDCRYCRRSYVKVFRAAGVIAISDRKMKSRKPM